MWKARGDGEGGTAAEPAPARAQVRVWDLPTRLFHWLLVILVGVSVFTGNVGGLRVMEWHERSGSAILALLLFRIAWGVVGSRHARFVDFVKGPRAVLAYARAWLRERHPPWIGHNPLGGWSVVAILISLLVQAITGLFSHDDILTKGPLAGHVSKATSNFLTGIHETNATVLYVLLVVHVGAIVAYRVIKGRNLVRPMITGWMTAAAASDDRPRPGREIVLAGLLTAAAAAIVRFVVTL